MDAQDDRKGHTSALSTTDKKYPTGHEDVRETTKTEIIRLGLGKPASLCLTQSSSSMKVNGELLSEASDTDGSPDRVTKEFTYTGYDISADVPQVAIDENSDEVERKRLEAIYHETCQRIGVVPVSYIAKRLWCTHLSMKSHGLGAKGTKAVAIALVGNMHVGSLNLEDNWIEGDGAKAIADMLKDNISITDLNISENRIGSDGLKALSVVLKDNDTIRKINISGNKLGDADAKYIADILENNYSLREMFAGHNEFGEIGGCFLGPALAANDTLENLDLSWNHLRGKGAMALSVGMQKNSGLKYLNISWNGFALDGCRVLGKSLLRNNTLVELDISNNRLHAEAVGALMHGIQRNDTLITLKIGNNPITPEIALGILKGLHDTRRSALMEIDMGVGSTSISDTDHPAVRKPGCPFSIKILYPSAVFTLCTCVVILIQMYAFIPYEYAD